MPAPRRKQQRQKSTAGAATAASVRKLAAACGVSPPAVHKWIDDERWPFGRKPPWDIELVRSWRASTLAPNPADEPGHRGGGEPTDYQKAKLLLALEKSKTERVKREILEGRFTKNEVIEAGQVQRINAIKSALFALARNVAVDLVGKTVDEIANTLQNRMIKLCNDFARDAETKG